MESKMALTLTEEVVRNRVRLAHDKCEDVKSIALPGTYHEKIVSLGNGLRKFTRLKSLDLSRNALESLAGIENLEMLEKLNLYYNNISTLDELKRLKHTPKLKELDLRLNPVTRSEPDYRLFLIHMLPDLQKLDDRGVRDRERQAALIHYSTSQATEMTYHPPKKEPTPKPPHPRVEYTARLGHPSVLDNDDIAMMDLVALKDGDLTRPRPLTGSAAKEPAMEEYSLEMLKSLGNLDDLKIDLSDQKAEKSKRPSSLPPPKNEDRMSASHREKYPNIANLAMEDVQDKISKDSNLKYQDELDAYSKYKSRGYFTPNPTQEGDDVVKERIQALKESHQAARESSRSLTEKGVSSKQPRWEQDGDRERDVRRETERRMKVSDGGRDRDVRRESEKRSKMSGDGDREKETRREHDKRVKGLGDSGESEAAHRHCRTRSVPEAEAFTAERVLPDPSQGFHQSQHPYSCYDTAQIQKRLDQSPAARLMLFRILDLVDRYWNGSKSLHQHSKFLGLALDEIEQLFKASQPAGTEPEVLSLRQRLERLQKENSYLQEHQQQADRDATTTSEAQLKKSLQEAHDDVENLREELKAYVKENARMQRKLEQQSSGASYNVSAAASGSNPLHLDELQRQNDALSREIENLRSRLKQYTQMKELASMLQESHKSLVQTNEHLLREMEEERRRYRQDVDQMNWSYEQLKKTVSFAPSSIKGDSLLNLNANSASAAGHYRDGDGI